MADSSVVSFPTPLPALKQPQDVGLYTDELNQIIRYINTIVYGDNYPSNVLLKNLNLSDLDNVVAARTNLGLGSAATQSSTAFDVAGAAATVSAATLKIAQNLADLNDKATARTNLQLGSASTHAASDFDPAGAAAARAAQGVNNDITALTALKIQIVSTNRNVIAGDQYLLVLATTGAKTITYPSATSAGPIRVVKGDATYNPVNISDGTTGPLIYSLVAPANSGYCQGVTVMKTTAGLKCF